MCIRDSVGVVLHIGPGPGRQGPLCVLVQFSIRLVAAQVIAEGQHPPHLLAALRKDMQIGGGIGGRETAVLEPVRLADAQGEPGGLQRRDIARFIGAVFDLKHLSLIHI